MIEFGIFAFVTSITPGPNNSMLMASGIRFGRKKSLPHFFGIWLGFNFLFFLGGNLLSYVPDIVLEYLQYAGYVVILYIAYRVAMTKTTTKEGSDEDKPFTFIQAALFQWVNPKGVVMAVSGLTAFQIPHLQANLILSSCRWTLCHYMALSRRTSSEFFNRKQKIRKGCLRYPRIEHGGQLITCLGFLTPSILARSSENSTLPSSC